MTQVTTSFFDRKYWLILPLFLVLLPFLGYGAKKATETNDNNIQQWLPDSFDESQLHKWFLGHFGSDEFVFVSWDGCSLDDPRVTKFSEAVEANEKGLFASATSGPELLKKLTSAPINRKKSQAKDDLVGLLLDAKHETTGTMVVFTHKGDEDRVGTIKALRAIALSDEVGVKEHELHMAGDAVVNAAVDTSSKQAIEGLLLGAGIVAFVMALLSMRSFRLLTTVFLVAIYCYALAQGMVYFVNFSSFSDYFGGKMNLVLVVMPVLVYVLAMSAGIHLVNYYRDIAEHSGLIGAPAKALKQGWVPCALAAGTTAVGVGSLCVSAIRPVKDFGSYSALGILGSLFVLFLFLPAVLVALDKAWIRLRGGKMPDWPRKQAGDKQISQVIGRLGRLFVDHHAVTSCICLAILATFAWGTVYIKTDLKPRRFFDADHQLNRDLAWLDKSIGANVPLELVVKIDTSEGKSKLNMLEQMELVESVEREIESMPTIRNAMSAATFAPPLGEDDQTKRDVMNTNLMKEKNRSILKDAKMYSEEDDFQLWRISVRMQSIDDSQGYDEFLSTVEDRGDEFLASRRAEYQRLKVGYQQAIDNSHVVYEKKLAEYQKDYAGDDKKIADEKEELDVALENYIRLRQIALDTLFDPATGVTIKYTGMVPLFYVAQRELFEGLVNSFVLAFGLIAVLMVILLRSSRAGLISMLPNVFPVAVIFGGMGWTGTNVDIGAMMTASVAMGIAVDDTVHFLTWFRRGMHEGLTRREAVLDAYKRCAQAMIQTTAIAGFSLLVFGLSSFQPVSQFGTLMFVLLVGALFGDLVFLPALLAGPVGRLFEERHKDRLDRQNELAQV